MVILKITLITKIETVRQLAFFSRNHFSALGDQNSFPLDTSMCKNGKFENLLNSASENIAFGRLADAF